jgi:hypothetical protein
VITAVPISGHTPTRKLLKALEEWHAYIANNKGFIPNYGDTAPVRSG